MKSFKNLSDHRAVWMAAALAAALVLAVPTIAEAAMKSPIVSKSSTARGRSR